jgi:putative molybdopterin biosynthesis protein
MGKFLQRTPLAEARALLLRELSPLAAETVATDEAAGRTTAAAVAARHPAPHYRASAMDGIALRSADTWPAADAAVVLWESEDGSGERPCRPIDTGGLLPDWADAVVRIEDVRAVDAAAGGGRRGWELRAVVPPGNDIRRAGEDIDAGVTVVPAGHVLDAWDIGALLAAGVYAVDVVRRPRVAIVATGSEIVEPPTPAGPGQVIEYNSRMLAVRLREWGAEPVRAGVLADDADAIEAGLRRAASDGDLVAVIAGSSVGRKDFTIDVLSGRGRLLVHGIDVMPGKPAAVAMLEDTAVVGIPGYPVSAIVTAEQLLRPAVYRLLGAAEPPALCCRATVTRRIVSRLGVEEFRRVALCRHEDGRSVVAPLPRGASAVSTVARAHGWLRIPATSEGIDAGAEVDVELLVDEDEAAQALVVATAADPALGVLEAALRRTQPRLRLVAMGLAAEDAADALSAGQAHLAVYSASDYERVRAELQDCLPGHRSLRPATGAADVVIVAAPTARLRALLDPLEA